MPSDIASEAFSWHHMKNYAAENERFPFCFAGKMAEKTAQCCLENLCGRAIFTNVG
jgi:hypothetical protein